MRSNEQRVFFFAVLLQNVCHGRNVTEVKVKVKVRPRTGHEGPEGEQRYSPILSLTSALDGGGWSMSRPGHFTPGKDPVHIV